MGWIDTRIDTLLVLLMTLVLFQCAIALTNIQLELRKIYLHIRDRGHHMGGVENKLERIRAELAKTPPGASMPGYLNHE